MSKQRQKGTQYENHVRDTYLRHIWPTADRAPLRGTADEGDFDGTPYVVEAKKRNAWRVSSVELLILWSMISGKAGPS